MSVFNNVSALDLTKYKAAGKPYFKGWVNAIADFLNDKFADEDTMAVATLKDSSTIGDGKSPAFFTAKTLYYTVGTLGVTGCDYNFVTAANHTEQVVQLGGGAVIPAKSRVIDVIVYCVDGLNGAITATVDVGSSSGGTEYIAAGNCDDTAEIVGLTAGAGPIATSLSATAASVYFAVDPDANWSTHTNGKWEIFVTYLDYSDVS